LLPGPGDPVVKHGIASRIGKLERRSGVGRGELLAVALPEGMDGDEALTALGLAPGQADLVVLVRQFFGETKPALLNRCPLLR
jgi:hypothetical protein